MTNRVVGVGVLGCGNVGAALCGLLAEQQREIAHRTGLDLQIRRVAVRNLARSRSVDLPDAVFTNDPHAVVSDPAVDVVVELIGGIEPARALTLEALALKKPVVTANKELIANVGAELYAAADAAEVDLLFEAAVAGGIPLLRALRESLIGEPIHRIMGIVNGTTNYILTRMSEAGVGYSGALAEAQSLGYAERDPTADVEGYDAGAKAAILATIAFGQEVVAGDVYHEGIASITSTDISFAARLGFVVKLLAVIERFEDAEIAVRVHPAMVPMEHPLASVRESFNAVFVEGGAVGDLMFYGRGAGGRPTASAVLGDLIDAGLNRTRRTHGAIGHLERARIRSIDELASAFYVNVEVADRPGVLAQVAAAFGDHEVSIRSMEQSMEDEGHEADARLIFITHVAQERNLQATLDDLRQLDVVRSVDSVLRVVAAD